MSALGPIGPAGSAPIARGDAASQAKVDYDAFLTLLVTEMKNQDPTKPMESTDFVAQLATFSNVEQGVQTNAKLDALLTASALASAGEVLGRSIETPDGAGTVASVRVNDGAVHAVLADGSQLALAGGWTLR